MKSEISNVRVIIKGNFKIFYEISDINIEVLFIWDCRQDPDSQKLFSKE